MLTALAWTGIALVIGFVACFAVVLVVSTATWVVDRSRQRAWLHEPSERTRRLRGADDEVVRGRL